MACPPTRPAEHTPGISLADRVMGIAGGTPAIPCQIFTPLRPSPHPSGSPVRVRVSSVEVSSQPRILRSRQTNAGLEVGEGACTNATTRDLRVRRWRRAQAPPPSSPSGPAADIVALLPGPSAEAMGRRRRSPAPAAKGSADPAAAAAAAAAVAAAVKEVAERQTPPLAAQRQVTRRHRLRRPRTSPAAALSSNLR